MIIRFKKLAVIVTTRSLPQTVKVKLTLGNYRKVAILKDGEDKSDAYNVLLKLDEMVNKK